MRKGLFLFSLLNIVLLIIVMGLDDKHTLIDIPQRTLIMISMVSNIIAFAYSCNNHKEGQHG